jgi:hypothetical protein
VEITNNWYDAHNHHSLLTLQLFRLVQLRTNTNNSPLMGEFLECLFDFLEKLKLCCINPQSQLFRFLSCMVSFFQDESHCWASSFLSKSDPSCESSILMPPRRLSKEVPELEGTFFVPLKGFLLSLARESILSPLFSFLSAQINDLVEKSGAVIPRGWTTAGSILPETATFSIVNLARRHFNHHARSGLVEKRQLFDEKDNFFQLCKDSFLSFLKTQLTSLNEGASQSLDLMLLSQKRFRFLHRYELDMDAELKLELDEVGEIE